MPTPTTTRRTTRGSERSTSADRPELRESLGGVAKKWMERFLVHGEGDLVGRRYKPLPWFVEFLWRWYELDPAERAAWWYREALVGAESGAAKTESFAALALLEFAGPREFRRPTPIITMAAASYDQAGELFTQAQMMAGGTKEAPMERAPLHGMFDVFDSEILYANGRPGRIQRVAAKAATAEGGKETLLLGDELHEWTGPKARVYTVRAKSLTKGVSPGRVCGMSTAAAGRGEIPARDTDPLLWRLYARGIVEQDDPTSRFLFDWREAPERIEAMRDDPEAIREALRGMRAPDVTWSVDVRAREIEKKAIPWHEALRYYFNRFVAMTDDSWLIEIPGIWEECAAEDAVPEDGSDVVVGVDMALHHDSVGVIVAGHLSDGRVGWWPRSWQPIDGRIDHLDVFSTIAGVIAQRWKVKAVTYDPRFFELPAQLLEDQGFKVVEFPQSPERLVPADGHLFQQLVAHRIAHPDDPVLNAHARHAAWRDNERGRYLSKSKAAGHMDLIRAGSMATWELEQPGEDDSKPQIW